MQNKCQWFSKHAERQLLGSPPLKCTKLWIFLSDEAYKSNHLSHTRNLSDRSLMATIVSSLLQSLSFLRILFLTPNIAQWILKLQCNPLPHVHLLFLLMDSGGNMRGMEGWLPSADLCPLLLLCSVWAPAELCGSLLRSFLSIASHWGQTSHAVCWEASVGRSTDSGTLQKAWSFHTATQGHGFPKTLKRSMGQQQGVLLFEGLFRWAPFPRLHCQPALALFIPSCLESRPVLACLLLCFPMNAERWIY